MGHEIHYCFVCAVRVTEADLARGAVRREHRVACSDCAPVFGLADEDAGPPDPPAPPARVAVRPRARLPLLNLAGAGLLGAGLLGSAWLLLDDGRSTPVPEDPTPAPMPEKASAPVPPKDREALGREALERVRSGPEEGRLERLRELAWAWDGTAAAAEAWRDVEVMIEPVPASPAPPVAAAPAPPRRPTPAPLPPVDRSGWDRARTRSRGLAAARDYPAAIRELKAELEKIGDGALRLEAEAEVAALESARAALTAGLAGLSKLPRGTAVALETWGNGKEPSRVEGRVGSSHPDGLVVILPLQAEPAWVDVLEVKPSTLALFPGVDPAGLGDLAAFETGPPLERRSLAERNDANARRLLRIADVAFELRRTRPDAVMAYRRLLETYADAPCVTEARSRLSERVRSCREVRLVPAELRATGTFERSSWKGRGDRVPDCWTSSEDIDWRESIGNYVEAVFPAVPGDDYRCWVYAGGCCLETFAFHFQSSGLVLKDPATGEEVAVDPGGPFAFPLKPRGFFRAKHVHHAGSRGPKQPERWQWIEIPIAEVDAPGLRRVRLLTDQKGFSVAYAVISADRDEPPSEEETRELAGLRAASPAGSPDPADWLVLAPLPNRGFGLPHGPESDLGLEELHASSAGRRFWAVEPAELRPAGPGKAAVFDFAARYEPSEHVVAFALLHVRSPDERPARLLLGSDDGVEVWHDGKRVHRLDRGRGLKLDEDRVALPLRQGWNRLLIKVYQGTGGWGLAARLTDPEGKPFDDLAYDPWGPHPAGPASAPPPPSQD